jgi:biotin operon repressor
MNITGEIYQIHGSMSDPSSIVLNKQDYERFLIKRKYITSKLMTYFAEYPVFIFGYGLGDQNVSQIISDLGEAIKENGGVLSNVYYIEWVPDVLSLKSLKEEHAVLVESSPDSTVRVKTVVTNDFLWILKAITDFSVPISVSTKTLRHLASRVIDLVRSDIPKNEIEIDYAKIEKLTGSNSELAMVLGITKTNNPNLDYPYTSKQAAKALGYKSWHGIQNHIATLNKKIGYDIKSKDNKYHIKVKTSDSTAKNSGFTRKFSEKFLNAIKEIEEEFRVSSIL